MNPLKLAINMPGAISAGAYTAGVLDFLTQALEAWTLAKANGETVPSHDVRIEVMTGASAGGMCAAISSLMLHRTFAHVDVNGPESTGTNVLYDSWVNEIDISMLLQSEDFKTTPLFVRSLLDSTVLDTIARKAIAPITEATTKPLVQRPYLSPELALVLSLTNLRGVPYTLNGVAPGSVEQTAMFYGDRIEFRFSHEAEAHLPIGVHLLRADAPAESAQWDLLRTAAMATGAFPLFLAPRAITRAQVEYGRPAWESCESAAEGTPPSIPPNFPAGMPSDFSTLNVDGGVTNNDPYNYAHDYLASLAPSLATPEVSTQAEQTDRVVLTIAPFPTTQAYSASFDAEQASGIFSVGQRLFAALIAQSRFFGESLRSVMGGTNFGHFIIAPSDGDLAKRATAGHPPLALQCASLGAFGGFFARQFRAHDFALGRRNCQKFLRDHFVLPVSNPLLDAGLPSDPRLRAAVLESFRRPTPSGQPLGDWLSVIPLCGDAVPEVPNPPRQGLSKRTLFEISLQLARRFRAVARVLVGQIPQWFLRQFLRPGIYVISWLAVLPVWQALVRALKEGSETRSEDL